MKKTIFTLLYLMAATTVVFYWPTIISGFRQSGGQTPRTLAESSDMDENAYFSLREVAAVQLGFVQISYVVDEESGQINQVYSNAACPNLQTSPQQLKEDQDTQQKILHEQILLLGSLADTDGSGYVSREEGQRFRDLCEFGYLKAHFNEVGTPDFTQLARAVGSDSTETRKNLLDYRKLQESSPENLKVFFP